jgi:hypothetical protein
VEDNDGKKDCKIQTYIEQGNIGDIVEKKSPFKFHV